MKKATISFSIKGFGIGVWVQDYTTYPKMKILTITFLFWSFFLRIDR